MRLHAEQLTPAFARWGEAAFYFSLDLSGGLARLVFQDRVDLEALRPVCRNAILENRAAVERSGTALFLKDTIIDTFVRYGPGYTLLTTFIENDLLSVGQPETTASRLLRCLYDDDLNTQIGEALADNDHDDVSFRALIWAAAHADVFEQVFEAAIALDADIANDRLSDWDRDIIDRNHKVYGRLNPLQGLIASIEVRELKSALERVLSRLSAAQRETMETMCGPHETV